jgi:hypothetical protein
LFCFPTGVCLLLLVLTCPLVLTRGVGNRTGQKARALKREEKWRGEQRTAATRTAEQARARKEQKNGGWCSLPQNIAMTAAPARALECAFPADMWSSPLAYCRNSGSLRVACASRRHAGAMRRVLRPPPVLFKL